MNRREATMIEDIRLKPEEILKAAQTAHPKGEEYPMWTKFEGRMKREVEAIANTATDEAIKRIVEWSEEICKEHYNWTEFERVLRRDCYECRQALKQLAKEK